MKFTGAHECTMRLVTRDEDAVVGRTCRRAVHIDIDGKVRRKRDH
jgi:hypothetical protein